MFGVNTIVYSVMITGYKPNARTYIGIIAYFNTVCGINKVVGRIAGKYVFTPGNSVRKINR